MLSRVSPSSKVMTIAELCVQFREARIAPIVCLKESSKSRARRAGSLQVSEPCPSWHWFGTMNAKLGASPARSAVSASSGLSFSRRAGFLVIRSENRRRDCAFAHRARRGRAVRPASGRPRPEASPRRERRSIRRPPADRRGFRLRHDGRTALAKDRRRNNWERRPSRRTRRRRSSRDSSADWDEFSLWNNASPTPDRVRVRPKKATARRRARRQNCDLEHELIKTRTEAAPRRRVGLVAPSVGAKRGRRRRRQKPGTGERRGRRNGGMAKSPRGRKTSGAA